MIDFIRIKVDRSIPVKYDSQYITINPDDSVIDEGKQVMFNRCFKIVPNAKYWFISGSLHQFYNDVMLENGLGNSNDFSHSQVIEALDKLTKYLGLELIHAKPTTIEFGYNILLDDPVKSLIDSVILYNEKPPSKNESNSQKNFKMFSSHEYDIKIYDKGLQYKDKLAKMGISASNEILRIEMRYKSDQLRRNLKINTLQDLTDKHVISKIHSDAQKKWSKLMIIDTPSFINTEIEPDIALRLLQIQTPHYWSARREKFDASTISKEKVKAQEALNICCSRNRNTLFTKVYEKYTSLLAA